MTHEAGARRVGVWIVGAYGNVGTLAVAGAAAIRRGLRDTTGLVTATSAFDGLDLVGVPELVFGGHEIREGSIARSAAEFDARNGLLPQELRMVLADDLAAADAEVRPGAMLNADAAVAAMAGPAVSRDAGTRDALDRIQSDMRSFRDRHALDEVVIVNLSSTEPRSEGSPALASRAAFFAALDSGETAGIPGSVLYAMAGVDAGFPYVDFTPAVAAGVPVVRETARLRGVPAMGRDGKTGETLVKTVLAPMFLARNMPVMSWHGVNMLGNRDGEVLRAPAAKASKVRDKDEALRRILPSEGLHSRVRIDYVPSLEDWKQAYDFIHFQGFLGARMQMHFLWQGCDSALAAPLVLDLVRLTDLARRRGESGTLPQLACFFKAPFDVEEQDFARQMDMLYRYADGARTAPASASA